MDHADSLHPGYLLLALAALIGSARLLGELARRFQQPAVLGELTAGVLLGPTVLGQVLPQWHATLFPTEGPNATVLTGIGTLAIVLFLLAAGMEVDLSIVWRQGQAALKVGVLGTVIPFAVGFAVAAFVPAALGIDTESNSTAFTLFFATAMAISALPVIAKTLMDLDLYRTDLGMIVVSAAILNDLIGWTIFAIVIGMLSPTSSGAGIALTVVLTLVFAIIMLTVGRWMVHRLLPFVQAYTHYPGGVLGLAVTLGLAGAAITEFIGIHAIFGAFLVGVALGDSSHLSERTRTLVDQFASFVFAPLFFASIGLRVNFIQHFDALLVLNVLLIAVVGKVLGAVWGARWAGLPTRTRWAIGFAMNARGAMEIILGTLALQAGIIQPPLFVALVVMAILTSSAAGPMIRRVLQRQRPHHLLSSLSSKLFLHRMQAETRRAAIRELADLAARHSSVDVNLIERLAWEREQTAATGIGCGVALPHARLDGIDKPIVIVGISEAGIAFDAPDGLAAQVVFLIVAPRSDPASMLELSAEISRLFRDGRCLEQLLRAKGYTEFLAALKTVRAAS